MGLNIIRHAAGAASTTYSGQSNFLFYKKAGAGVANTDVDVFINSAYIGTMNPSDYAKYTLPSREIRLVPVDPANACVFISADREEEFGTSQVAGNVTVSNFPASFNVGNFPAETLVRDSYMRDSSGKVFNETGFLGIAASTGTAFSVVNPVGSGLNYVVTDIYAKTFDITSGAAIGGCETTITKANGIGGAIPATLIKFRNNNNSALTREYVASGAPGLTLTNPVMLHRAQENISFSQLRKTPIYLPPGTALRINLNHPTGAFPANSGVWFGAEGYEA